MCVGGGGGNPGIPLTHILNATFHVIILTGADKFSETFLGEFDTPEAIWSSEMRQMMIQKIAAHIADFSPRLLSNTRATYQVSSTILSFSVVYHRINNNNIMVLMKE